MRTERPSFPEWPAWIGLACFLLAGLFLYQQRPVSPVVEGPAAAQVYDGTEWRAGESTLHINAGGTDASCEPFLGLGQYFEYMQCVWTLTGQSGPAPAVPEPPNYTPYTPLDPDLVEMLKAYVGGASQEAGVTLSKASEDRIVRRLQQWLDANEARALPAFGR